MAEAVEFYPQELNLYSQLIYRVYNFIQLIYPQKIRLLIFVQIIPGLSTTDSQAGDKMNCEILSESSE